jgi:hypothetical protein
MLSGVQVTTPVATTTQVTPEITNSTTSQSTSQKSENATVEKRKRRKLIKKYQ